MGCLFLQKPACHCGRYPSPVCVASASHALSACGPGAGGHGVQCRANGVRHQAFLPESRRTDKQLAMCGIVGIVEPLGQLAQLHELEAMNEAILHRGPDDKGTFLDREAGIGMRRLSIIDVRGGRQPIHNEDRTVWTVFNGEIYNYRELRRDLESKGHRFETDSDTETLVHLYEEYGPRSVQHLRGMFAFAIWDSKERSLLLVRDRIGIKPLYYACFAGRFIFGSELKALLRVEGLPLRLNPSAIQEYLSLLYVPGPHTVFEGVHEVPPGHYLVYANGKVSLQRYWEVRYHGEERFDSGEWSHLFLSQFKRQREESPRQRCPPRCVPFGGNRLQRDRRSYGTRVGPSRRDLLDRPRRSRLFPRRTALCSHRCQAIQDKSSRAGGYHRREDLLPKLARCFDQPFADSSAIPNYYISQLTREYVTVALSGLGGDEIGAGYERHLGMVFAESYRKLPKVLRHHLLEKWILRAREDKADQLWLNRIKRFIAAADLAPPARYATMQSAYSLVDQERLLAREFRGRSQAITPESLMARAMGPELVDSVLNGALLADLHSYLPGDLLTLTDRVSMRHSLEVRVPFLDHRLVELMARVPARYKASGWTKKKLLKQAFSSFLPREILYRKKMGFSVPMALWLRTDLSPTMKDVLSPEELKRIPYLNVIRGRVACGGASVREGEP